jgi:hypothetical protein
MLNKIKMFIAGNRESDEFDLSVPVDLKRAALEHSMYELVSAAKTRVLAKGGWKPSCATRAAEAELLDLFDKVVLHHASFSDFEAAVDRWESLQQKK